MSYEHCDRHDMDATNGCAQCAREGLARGWNKLEDAAQILVFARQYAVGEPLEKARENMKEAAREFVDAERIAREVVPR